MTRAWKVLQIGVTLTLLFGKDDVFLPDIPGGSVEEAVTLVSRFGTVVIGDLWLSELQYRVELEALPPEAVRSQNLDRGAPHIQEYTRKPHEARF